MKQETEKKSTKRTQIKHFLALYARYTNIKHLYETI
jgi:hypothetical protein